MATNSVQELSDAELLADLSNAKQKLFDLRFQLATGALEDTSQITTNKRRVARVLTELREREIAAADAAAKE